MKNACPSPARRRRVAIAVVAAAVAMAACGADDEGGAEPPGDDPGVSDTTAPALDGDDRPSGGTLTMAIGSNPAHLNPAITSDMSVLTPMWAVYESLITLTDEYEIEPFLAESWEVSDDQTVYTFDLQDGVTWHDGEPFDAHDVVFSLTTTAPLHPLGEAVTRRIEQVVAVDENTVEVTLNEPYGAFLAGLNPMQIPIVPEHIFGEGDVLAHPANHSPVGTGPYRFVNFETDQRIELERNTDYWGEVQPAMDRVVVSVVPDPSTRLLSLENGEIDLVPGMFVDQSQLERLRHSPDLLIDVGQNRPAMTMLAFNVGREPFDNRRVRQALAMALDRDLMAQVAFDGAAAPGESAIPRAIAWATNEDVSYTDLYPYDPEAARQLLAEAGVSNLTIELPIFSSLTVMAQTAEVIRSNWTEVGVDVTIVDQERSVWSDRVFSTRDFDATIVYSTALGDPALGIERAYVCKGDSTVAFLNASTHCDDELDAAWASAATALDQSERAVFYANAQAIVAEELPTLLLLENSNADAIRGNAVGGTEEFLRSGRWEHLFLR